MVIEKLRSEEGLGGRLGSTGGRLGSIGADTAPVATQPVAVFQRDADQSVISQRLGGKTGMCV